MAAERVVELAISRRNRRRLLARGGVERGAAHYPWMVALHVAVLAGSAAEVWLLERPFLVPVAAAAGGLLAVSMALRYWVIATLGERWTTRVIVVPGAPAATHGPYRFLRHPNYVAVAMEGVAVPMIHTAFLTALLFTSLNALLLRVRVRAEEEALSEGGDWAERFADLPRFVPGGR